MILLLFLGALLFFIIPNQLKRNISFIDYYLLYCLYFDATTVFAGGQMVNYMYFQHFSMFIFSVIYIFRNWNGFTTPNRKVLFLVFIFFLILIFSPVIKGLSLNQSLRQFSVNYNSLIILPLAFHYYSGKGDIVNLFKTGYYFLVVWMTLVIFFTVFRIAESSGYLLVRTTDYVHGGGILFFGNMGVRGAITYISFAILIVPIFLRRIVKVNKSMIFIIVAFVIVVLLINLKRFSFVVIVLALFNYLLKSNVRLSTKIIWTFSLVFLTFMLFSFSPLNQIVSDRFDVRGGDRKFSIDAIEGDLRIYEPLYVFEYVFEGSFLEILMGRETSRTMDVFSELHQVEQRQIHNQYAQYLYIYGIIGFFSYLLIFLVLYYLAHKYRNILVKSKIDINEYWIVFQNYVLIFIAAGMVGGHVHVTFRGMVLLFAGAFCGHFYKLIKEHKIAGNGS